METDKLSKKKTFCRTKRGISSFYGGFVSGSFAIFAVLVNLKLDREEGYIENKQNNQRKLQAENEPPLHKSSHPFLVTLLEK